MSAVDEPDSDGRIGKRAASGVLWLAANKWMVRVSGFATLIVLAHQVSPREFGVVAAAMTVIPMVYLLSDMGFSTFLLQADDIDEETLSTAFWTSVACGAVLSAGLVALAPLVANAFQSPELVQVLRVLVFAVVPTVLAGVPLSLLRRGMEFRSLALQSLFASMFGQVLAVLVALRGGGVWALVSQVIVTQLVVAVLAWRKAAWRPSLRLSWWRLRRMVAFGIRVSSVDLVAMARMLAESWIITLTLGAPALGLLNVGQRLVLVAQELVAASIVPVSTIVFARVRDSVDRLRRTYLKALGVAYAAVSPVMILIVVTAPELIPLIFGAQWSASVQPAQALAVAGIITLGAMVDHGLLYGLGRPGTWFSYAVVVDGVTVATTAITVRWGLTGVAVGFVVVAMLATVARWLLVSRLCGWGVRGVARPFFTVASVTAVTIVLGTVVLDALSGRTWVGLIVAAAATVVGYAVLLRLASRGIIRDALSVLPVPDQYADRAVRLLRLGRAHAA